jgi:uncharacterized membrane protein YqhA
VSGTRLIAAIGALSLFVAGLATFVWGAVSTILTIISLLRTGGGDPHLLVSLIRILDIFLIGAALFIFAASLFELFVGELDVPGWLVIRNIDQLKTKMIAIVVLVMAITFLEHLVDWVNAQATELFGIGIAVVSLVLVFLYRSGSTE